MRHISEKQKTLACAVLATALAFGWQLLVVHYSYDGKWTGLFCVGDRSYVPPPLDTTALYRFPDSPGHDGQFYYFIAHHPVPSLDYADYLDNSLLRWRRILVPALAHLFGLGRENLIGGAYIGIILASVFMGTWWLSLFCARAGCSPFWGVFFPAIPAVSVSLDRMTVDAALAALCVGYSYHGVTNPSWRIYPVLLLATLARETGLVLVAAFCLHALLRKEYRVFIAGGATALPWLAWEILLRMQLPADGTPWMSLVPLSGLIWRTFHPLQFDITGIWLGLAAFLDNVALLGIWTGFYVTARLIRRGKLGLLELTCVSFALSVMFVAKQDVWADAYAFGRTMSPLLIWTGLSAVVSRGWEQMLPLALNVPRIAFQIATVSIPFVRGLLKDALALL